MIPSTLPVPDDFRLLKDGEVLVPGVLLWHKSLKAFTNFSDGAIAGFPSGQGAYKMGGVYLASHGLPGIIHASIAPTFVPEVIEEEVTIREKESIAVLRECMDLQIKKSNDYQNPNSRIRQADYYPNGVKTILDIMHAKMLRMYSVLEAMENDPNYKPNFESIEDSGKDLVNYSSFMVAYCRGGIDGQMPERDFLNRKRKP